MALIRYERESDLRICNLEQVSQVAGTLIDISLSDQSCHRKSDQNQNRGFLRRYDITIRKFRLLYDINADLPVMRLVRVHSL